MLIRIAGVEDAQAINRIFSHYIRHSLATFNEFPRTDAQRAEEIAGLLASYPYLVAQDESGELLGFACAEPVRAQSGYRYCVELTIYLSPCAPKRCGVGSALYGSLLPMLRAQGYCVAYAVISGVNGESLRFHERMGFSFLARFEKSGYKNGQWLDTVWMQKDLAPRRDRMPPPVPFALFRQKMPCHAWEPGSLAWRGTDEAQSP